MLPWLSVVDVQKKRTRLTLREAATLFDRSKSAIRKDCDFLGISTACTGGCISKQDAWFLYVFLCWKKYKTATCADWRGDRKDWNTDCPTDAAKLFYVSKISGSEGDLSKRFDEALFQVNHQHFDVQPRYAITAA
ncbi:MAG: hypothetical protein ACFB2W_00730 [Leptolyngbyaceae cyanobacterium]